MTPQTRAYALHRVPSGIPGLDRLLSGGLFQGGMYFVSGAPGTGKTTLANQVCFNHVAAGGRVVYLTLQTEHHSRMLAHLATFRFFAPDVIGDTLQYYSGTTAIQNADSLEFAQHVQHIIRDHRATMLVIDGLENFKSAFNNGQKVKEALHALHAYAEASHCSVLLLGPHSPAPANYEETIVDGVIVLRTDAVGLRTIRLLEVSKLRGSGFVSGQHVFVVNDAGIVVYPRTEAVHAFPSQVVPASDARLAFGVAELDEMLQGGLYEGSTTMLLGTPGCGKTILGLHFLAAGARLGQQGLYYGLYETPERLVDKADRIGLALSAAQRDGQIEIVWNTPIEDLLDVHIDRLLDAVRRQGVRRLFLDGVDAFRQTTYPERLGPALWALSNELRALNVTTCFSSELRQLLGPQVELPLALTSPMSENILFLRTVELRAQMHRLISIMKIRNGGYDPAIREFTIGSKGISLVSGDLRADAMLTGTARPLRRRMESPAAAEPGGEDEPEPGAVDVPTLGE